MFKNLNIANTETVQLDEECTITQGNLINCHVSGRKPKNKDKTHTYDISVYYNIKEKG